MEEQAPQQHLVFNSVLILQDSSQQFDSSRHNPTLVLILFACGEPMALGLPVPFQPK